MSANELLKQIYTKFYEQQEVLTEAPKLTQVPDDASFDAQKADAELAGVVSYLMGVPDIQKESFEQAVQIIQDHYGDQPEWQELLIEYFEYATEKEKENLEAQEAVLVQEIKDFTKKLLKEDKDA